MYFEPIRKALESLYRHVHVAASPMDNDTCDVCGWDIRNPIHAHYGERLGALFKHASDHATVLGVVETALRAIDPPASEESKP